MYDYYVTYSGILYESTVHVPIYIDLCKIHVRILRNVPAIGQVQEGELNRQSVHDTPTS